MKSLPKADATWFDSVCLILSGAIGSLSVAWWVATFYSLIVGTAAWYAVLSMLLAFGGFILSALVVLYEFRYRIVLVREEELRHFAERDRDFWQGRAWQALDKGKRRGVEEDTEEQRRDDRQRGDDAPDLPAASG